MLDLIMERKAAEGDTWSAALQTQLCYEVGVEGLGLRIWSARGGGAEDGVTHSHCAPPARHFPHQPSLGLSLTLNPSPRR